VTSAISSGTSSGSSAAGRVLASTASRTGEKFDYWAVFWGMGIIGGSGLLLWFPVFFAHIVPGWVFNIAMLVHGEEALLAVGFIFTMHFFKRPSPAREVPDGHRHLHGPRHARRVARGAAGRIRAG
jgi:LPXTG-motif cell wall-anchored protein